MTSGEEENLGAVLWRRGEEFLAHGGISADVRASPVFPLQDLPQERRQHFRGKEDKSFAGIGGEEDARTICAWHVSLNFALFLHIFEYFEYFRYLFTPKEGHLTAVWLPFHTVLYKGHHFCLVRPSINFL